MERGSAFIGVTGDGGVGGSGGWDDQEALQWCCGGSLLVMWFDSGALNLGICCAYSLEVVFLLLL